MIYKCNMNVSNYFDNINVDDHVYLLQLDEKHN